MRALVALVVFASCTSRSAPRVVDASVVFAKRGTDETVEGRIHCTTTRADEVACALSHEGDRTFTVCFHIELTCLNGYRATAEACRETAPGTEVRTMHSVEGCDGIDVGRVTDAWIINK
jgi:hypothetical protein